jgi:Putative DNA-binding domain
MPTRSQRAQMLRRGAVPPLADLQRRVRHAVVTGDAAGIEPHLVGGARAMKRLAIHHRHYETSLVTALLGKFPATAWLVGTPFLSEAATSFVRQHPPKAPCIAEYGEGFPAFLSTCPGVDRVPYLQGFTQLEWHVGHVAVAADRTALTVEEFSHIETDVLPNARLTLQTGLRYLQAPWPIDDLMRIYLTNRAPDQLSLERAEVWIELRGARGEFQINRLELGAFTFRKAVQAHRSIAAAAEQAIESDGDFEPGRALAALITDDLVAAMTFETRGDDR